MILLAKVEMIALSESIFVSIPNRWSILYNLDDRFHLQVKITFSLVSGFSKVLLRHFLLIWNPCFDFTDGKAYQLLSPEFYAPHRTGCSLRHPVDAGSSDE